MNFPVMKNFYKNSKNNNDKDNEKGDGNNRNKEEEEMIHLVSCQPC